jgi:transcription elongation factor Elf1
MSDKASLNSPWYWICSSDKPNSTGFNCKEAVKSKAHANIIVKKRNIKKEKGKVWWIRESPEHPDRDFKQFQCPDCKNMMSQRELDHTWDWAGPHCDNCGCTGLEMFVSVTEHAPVVSGAGEATRRLGIIARLYKSFFK